jgi:hypothetical protein
LLRMVASRPHCYVSSTRSTRDSRAHDPAELFSHLGCWRTPATAENAGQNLA